MLAQPSSSILRDARRILFAGCGGGYDILGAVPLLVELMDGQRELHLANLSFCYLNGLEGARQNPEHPNLYEIPESAATEASYCPEAWLARWVQQRLGLKLSVWGFDKTGVRPLLAAYRYLARLLRLDAIVLVDGGIDSLLRGDESSLGTPAEDLASLAAVNALDVPSKMLACVGLGAESRDGICHAQVFDRIAEIARHDGYLGSAALVAQTRAGQLYRDAIEWIFENQARERRSHIHRVVLAAMLGGSGADGPHIWLSPLLSQYWFFDLGVVARTHLFLDDLLATDTIWEVTARIEGIRKSISIQGKSKMPI
ncbi:MAG: DUF1152 domain-containing protein [Pseudomonadota bacterium]